MTFFAFQMGWLNYWINTFRIIKAGQLINYYWPTKER